MSRYARVLRALEARPKRLQAPKPARVRPLALTPQSQPLPGRAAEMHRNAAGGYVFAIDPWAHLDRLLLLGTLGGTYYVDEKALTLAAVREAVLPCLKMNGRRVVQRLVEISVAGRARSNEPTVMVLALALAHGLGQDSRGARRVRRAAAAAATGVLRTGTDLLHFCAAVSALRGWGKLAKGVLRQWLREKDIEYQMVKYRQRDGWAMRDVLRVAHPVPEHAKVSGVYQWVTHGTINKDTPPLVVHADRAIHAVTAAAVIGHLACTRGALPWEAINPDLLKSPAVWRALLPTMPLKALTRNLGRLTALGVVEEMAPEIVTRYGDEEIKRARLHPLDLFIARETYGRGHGLRGRLAWTPAPPILKALDSGFEAAVANVEATGLRLLLAIDVSGSMATQYCAGSPALRPRDAAAAMAYVLWKTQPLSDVITFSANGQVWTGPQRRDAVQSVDGFVHALRGAGGTDLSLPAVWATQQARPYDGIVVFTDDETWAGHAHPQQALALYRASVAPGCKLVCLSTAATRGSVVDPEDDLAFGIAGFDAEAPRLALGFIRDA